MYATDMETVEDNIRQSLKTNGGKQAEQQQQLGPLDVASMPRVLTADQITEHDLALGLQKDVPELQALDAELAQRLLKSFMNQLNNASMKPSVAQNIAMTAVAKAGATTLKTPIAGTVRKAEEAGLTQGGKSSEGAGGSMNTN